MMHEPQSYEMLGPNWRIILHLQTEESHRLTMWANEYLLQLDDARVLVALDSTKLEMTHHNT